MTERKTLFRWFFLVLHARPCVFVYRLAIALCLAPLLFCVLLIMLVSCGPSDVRVPCMWSRLLSSLGSELCTFRFCEITAFRDIYQLRNLQEIHNFRTKRDSPIQIFTLPEYNSSQKSHIDKEKYRPFREKMLQNYYYNTTITQEWVGRRVYMNFKTNTIRNHNWFPDFGS